jgi:hypothetical protein
MKISHKQLEACRFSPKSWVASKQSSGGFGRLGYRQALALAISEFHKKEDIKATVVKIDGYVAKNFKNEMKISKLYTDFDQYTKWYQSSGIISAEANILLNFPSSGDWHLGGYVSRVDLILSGYRAILFEVPGSGWKDQLRMPLIQLAIANRYGRPASEVRIGLQDLDGNSIVETQYGTQKRSDALSEFQKLGGKVLALWPQP